ncbi:hypothetical protein C0J52_25867 [Blattella germanica]|nr:hypothetical protein C0J52_25867 [Blattella germanica]
MERDVSPMGEKELLAAIAVLANGRVKFPLQHAVPLKPHSASPPRNKRNGELKKYRTMCINMVTSITTLHSLCLCHRVLIITAKIFHRHCPFYTLPRGTSSTVSHITRTCICRLVRGVSSLCISGGGTRALHILSQSVLDRSLVPSSRLWSWRLSCSSLPIFLTFSFYVPSTVVGTLVLSIVRAVVADLSTLFLCTVRKLAERQRKKDLDELWTTIVRASRSGIPQDYLPDI